MLESWTVGKKNIVPSQLYRLEPGLITGGDSNKTLTQTQGNNLGEVVNFNESSLVINK